MQNKIITMLKLQNDMNALVNPDWRNAGYKWMRAVMVEGVEGIEFVGWKWWKKQEIDLPQLQIELIDIFHFAISHMLVSFPEKNLKWIAEEIELSMNPNNVDIFYQGEIYESDQSIIEDLELMVGMAAFNYFSFSLFTNLMNKTDLTFDKLFETYVAKNILNQFRQRNGYKTGSYIKDWSSVKLENTVIEGRALEDNDHLHDIMVITDSDRDDYAANLLDVLQKRYGQVTGHIYQGNHSHYDEENCDVCKLEKENAILREKEAKENHEESLIVTAEWVLDNARPNNDGACSVCNPNGKYLIEGFTCTYHRALALVEAKIQRKGVESNGRHNKMRGQ